MADPIPLKRLTTLTRQQLGQIIKDPQSLLEFEKFFLQVAQIIPDNFVAFQNLEFVVTSADPSIPHAHVITEGDNIDVAAADGLVTISATPTGADGQIQFNHAGKFGGFTMGGDATIDVLTGILSLEATGVEAGTYASPTLTIDAKGRVTDAEPGLWGVAFSTPDIATKPPNTVLGRAAIPFAWTLPATTSTPPGYVEGKVDGAPSAQTDFDLLKDGASVGTLRFASGSTTPTLIKGGNTAFAAGDYFDLKSPSNFNGMSGVFGVAVMGVR